jgi:hypothetical protein
MGHQQLLQLLPGGRGLALEPGEQAGVVEQAGGEQLVQLARGGGRRGERRAQGAGEQGRLRRQRALDLTALAARLAGRPQRRATTSGSTTRASRRSRRIAESSSRMVAPGGPARRAR